MQGEVFSKAMECAQVACLPSAGKATVATHGLMVTPDCTLFNSELGGTDSPFSSHLKGPFSAEEQPSGPIYQVKVMTRSGKRTDPLANMAEQKALPCEVQHSQSHSSGKNSRKNRVNSTRRKPVLRPEKGKKVLDAQSSTQASPDSESSRFSGTIEIHNGLNYFSSYRRYVNVWGWIYRFANNLLARQKNLDPQLTKDERQYGEKILLRSIQKAEFALEYKLLSCNSKTRSTLINQLGLFFSSDHLIRCKGRMEYSDLNFASKYPILLPKKHRITDLIIENSHRLSLHYGLSQTVNFIRQRYWIPQIRQRVKVVLRRCLLCRKLQGNPFQAPSAPLPEFRSKYLDPFKLCGVDYSGHILVR